jgi:cell division protein FtsQ
MKKSLFFWLYFIVSIILAVYFAARIITSQMGRGPVSYVKHISIISDSKDADLESVKMAIGITNGTNIKSVDLHQINKRIMNVPGIKNASTRRLANGDIIVKTQQHKIAAQWSDGVNFYPLSLDGVKIDKPTSERNSNTIVFQGIVPGNLDEIINGLTPISKYIDYVNMVESRRWNIHTINGTVIYLPEDNLSIAVNKINVLNQTHKILSRQIDIIDMRDNARILVKTKK